MILEYFTIVILKKLVQKLRTHSSNFEKNSDFESTNKSQK